MLSLNPLRFGYALDVILGLLTVTRNAEQTAVLERGLTQQSVCPDVIDLPLFTRAATAVAIRHAVSRGRLDAGNHY